jgi:hypothetical protein
VAPFHLRFTLSRRQRVAELLPWLPAVAGTIGFGMGAAFLATVASPWFLLLLLLPVIYYRGLFFLLIELAFWPQQSVEVFVDETQLEVRTRHSRRSQPLDGIIQVFRSGEAWTVLHLDRTSLLIPIEAITHEQIDYLKAFALRAAAERKAQQAKQD